MGTRKHTYEYVKSVFEDRGYTLISKEYINSHAFLDAICPNEHQYKTKFYNFLMVKGCRICAGKEKYSIEQVIEIASKNNFDVIDKEYKSALSKIHIRCRTCGYESKKNFSLVKRGFGCKKCQYVKLSKKQFIRFKNKDIEIDIDDYLRKKIKRTQWFKQTRLVNGNKCVITGTTKNTEVHHIINFKTILNETLNELGLSKNSFSFNELWKIKRLFFIKQERYGHGVLFSKKIHILFHSIYGKENNTKEQIDEFIYKVKNGEIKI